MEWVEAEEELVNEHIKLIGQVFNESKELIELESDLIEGLVDNEKYENTKRVLLYEKWNTIRDLWNKKGYPDLRRRPKWSIGAF